MKFLYYFKTSHKHSSFNTIQHKYEENTRKLALYGGRQTITMIPGDGIGPEVMDGVKKVFLAAGQLI